MNQELERQLVDNYSELYEAYDWGPDDIDGAVPPLTAYGFQHGDGWYNLLESLSETLTRLDVEIQVHQCEEGEKKLRIG